MRVVTQIQVWACKRENQLSRKKAYFVHSRFLVVLFILFNENMEHMLRKFLISKIKKKERKKKKK